MVLAPFEKFEMKVVMSVSALVMENDARSPYL
ncbi:hypothetical protein PF010_g29234 [Phytophthora fragariae]|uniref:Uncharacterized protein n=1 Tax=Phytophthora fragariae TaxID=53985 RepID=A0A6A3W5H0_9STRA|nr:hypothetical protein PF011_g26803 [Phytophthora fragariae]KAE9062846.1 hypothetical protein PF010_g29234 [Phytophthora fragariae]KAE9075746.1 hypothetical protein PF006_g28276 [Phytophthora fragariae]KAE9173780.1 hypothetical protein PF002_g29228 [Phytophthora fragariae]